MLPEKPSRFSLTDLTVFVLCECTGIPLCIAGGDGFAHSDYAVAAVGWGIGLPLSITGFTFPFWKDSMRTRVAIWTDAWAGTLIPIVVLLAFAYVVGPDMYRRATQPPAAMPVASPAPEPAQSQFAPTIRPIPPTVDISGDLTILSNEEVRVAAYVLAAKIDGYTNGCIEKFSDIDRNKAISDAEKGTLKLQFDAACSKDFRTKFSSDVLKVQAELQRRLKLPKDPSTIAFASGTLDIHDMGMAAFKLRNLAKLLP